MTAAKLSMKILCGVSNLEKNLFIIAGLVNSSLQLDFYVAMRNIILILSTSEHLNKEKDSSYCNCGICHIECRPMVCSNVDIDKINHLSETHPVYKIPQSSRQNERE
jgi:hypothetical protein